MPHGLDRRAHRYARVAVCRRVWGGRMTPADASSGTDRPSTMGPQASPARTGRTRRPRIDAPLVVTAALSIPPDELAWRFSRSSGPGGQGVNTADSRVELRWVPEASSSFAGLGGSLRALMLHRLRDELRSGAVVVVAAQDRAQLRNRELALGRLAEILRTALAPPSPRRRATRPTKGSVERRLAGKRVRSTVKAQRSRPAED